MPEINLLGNILAALVPMVIGAIFYGPLFGKQWLASLDFKADSIPEPIKMPIVYVVSLVLAFVFARFMGLIMELVHRDVNDAGEMIFTSHNTFGHGAFHGFFFALVLVMPILVSNLLFQRNKLSNILLNVVYWLVTISIMMGVMDAF